MGLQGRVLVLGITGSIAAYKAADLAQRFRHLGAEVHVIMTHSATQIVGSSVLHAITGNPVIEDLFQAKENKDPMAHITLANRAHLMIIAPATGNIIGKLAQGIADNALTTTALAMKAPILIAPAMHDSMWKDPATQDNIQKLKSRGFAVIAPEWGSLAAGDVGEGRMADLEVIVGEVIQKISPPADLTGIHCLVTAGGTREPIDPVRFVGNRSSGKMGVALAQAALQRGARVTMVCGAVTTPLPAGVRILKAETAEAMRKAVLLEVPKSQVVLMAAAVADFRPEKGGVAHKVKRTKAPLKISLTPTSDILQEIRKIPGKRVVVGFAAETENLLVNAKKKLTEKKLDILVANDITQPGAGFDVDTNLVTILNRGGDVESLPLLSKEEVAGHILDAVSAQLK